MVLYILQDYANDPCMDSFTAGQTERMRNQWLVHRAGERN
jgi:hypothetical protein